jgi:hypothetical protein
MIKFFAVVFLLLTIANVSFSQDEDDDDHKFRHVYPVGDAADIQYKFLRYHSSEKILFEANPIVRYSFHNKIRQRLMTERGKHASAYYLSFRPQLRMYDQNSKPVKTPSYRIFVATQHVWKVHGDNLFAASFETGHYSNGQDGSAFSELFDDDSPESDSVYALITDQANLSSILNRSSANFSTNVTEVMVNYRFNKLDDNSIIKRWHLLKIGTTIYQDRLLYFLDIGGFSDNDIKIYGRMRYVVGYEYMQVYNEARRSSIATTLECISNPHPHVNPWRWTTTATYFPCKKNEEFGIFLSFTTGHDDYNFRFVDRANQFAFGMTWNAFPAIQLGTGE